MPPRQRALPTDFDSRLARIVAADGRQALAGMSRVGSGRGKGRGNQSVLVNVPEQDAAGSSAHLLAMSVTGASIAADGDHIPFATIVAQHGFATVVLPGEGWVHPVSGVYLLTFEMAWASYTGGGTVQLEVDRVNVPEGTILSGTAGREGRGTIAYVAEEGQVGKVKVTHTSGSAQTCDAVVRVAITDPKTAAAAAPAASTGVVSLGTQDIPDIVEWTAGGAAWVDGDAEWIWHTALDGTNSRPSGEEGWFEGIVDVVSAVDVVIEFSADNSCEVSLNGVLLGTNAGFTTRTAVAATLAAGSNVFEAHAQNGSGSPNPAGFILSVQNVSTGAAILRTDDAFGWTGYTAQPAGWTGP